MNNHRLSRQLEHNRDHIMHYRWLRHFRRRLADTESLLHFSVLGIVSGLTCGLIMFAFHHAVHWPSSLWLPEGNPDNFEGLTTWQRFALPVFGAVVIGLILKFLPAASTRTGVTHVITRLHSRHGHLPTSNTLVQFFLGAFALGTGQSGGREGPSIHLGAGINSWLGQKLLLPNNSIRVLVGCGTAAAIAAAFNTPIAGVIFAMEVVMMEYTIAGFIPVMLASVTATALIRALEVSIPFIDNPVTEMTTLWELPYITALGLIVGCAAATFITILKAGARQADKAIEQRMLLAGLITGCCAIAVPEVLGLGYDSLMAATRGELGVSVLLALMAAKLIATAVSCGLGMPIGLIGPNLLIGACLGAAMGVIGNYFFPEQASDPSFYALLGMAAMMGAVLNAPLAALMAIVELTQSTAIIFPAMLVITVAALTNSEIFKQQSATQTLLTQLREVLRTDPLSLALQRSSVASLMTRQLTHLPQQISPEQADQLLDLKPNAVVISDQQHNVHVIAWSDLHSGLENALIDCQSTHLDLLELAQQAAPAANLHIQATLREALDTMNQQQVDTVFVSGYIAGGYHGEQPDQGLLTRADIQQYAAQPQ